MHVLLRAANHFYVEYRYTGGRLMIEIILYHIL